MNAIRAEVISQCRGKAAAGVSDAGVLGGAGGGDLKSFDCSQKTYFLL